MLVIGDERGFISFGSLVFNGVILVGLVFLIAKGMNLYLLSILASILITYVTLVHQNGKNVKSIASLLSVLLVMAVLSLGILWIINRSHIGGYNEIDKISEEAMYLSTNIGISMNQVMVCVVLMGLLGAIMDTSIAITTAVYEVYRNNNELSFLDLMNSGRTVGRDILGTTANTLFFAGMGESMMLFIWLGRMRENTFAQLINSKAFLQEMMIIIISNIGCILIIPTSVLVIGVMLKQKKFEFLRRFYEA